MKILSSPSHDHEKTPLVNLGDITEVELLILRRMREFTMGEHASLFQGSGFDFVGLREWQDGDRFTSIDWPQSTLTNFSPLIVREYEQPTTAAVVAVADGSLSTRCGLDGVPIAAAIARAIATFGMSAVFFQDLFGLMTFKPAPASRDGNVGWHLEAVRPRIGKGQVIHCLDAYQFERGMQDVRQSDSISRSLAGFMRKTTLIPVISDFLFERPGDVIRELVHLDTMHDVFLVMIDASFAFDLPKISAGWVDAFDVETGRTRVMSRSALRNLATRVREWQDDVEKTAKQSGLDVLRLGLDSTETVIRLTEFVMERRLRKK